MRRRSYNRRRLWYLARYNKFIVALTMTVLYFISDYYGVEMPVDESTVAGFWMFISAILTYLIPNIYKDDQEKTEEEM